MKSFKIEHLELAESKKEFVPETGLSTFFSKLVSRFFVSNRPSKLIFMKFLKISFLKFWSQVNAVMHTEVLKWGKGVKRMLPVK